MSHSVVRPYPNLPTRLRGPYAGQAKALLLAILSLFLVSCEKPDEDTYPEVSRPVAEAPSVKDCTIDWSKSRGSCDASGSCEERRLNASYPDDKVGKCPVEINTYGTNVLIPETKTFYIEFNKDGDFNEAQNKGLLTELQKPGPKHIIFFVHGFRNNADARTGDPGRFATMMAYMSAFIARRCDPVGSNRFGVTCTSPANISPSKTIGVFIGWQGAPIIERVGEDETRAALEFNSKKELATKIARKVIEYIQETSNSAKTTSNGAPIRTLVFGHSLGGHILLSGLLAGDRPQGPSDVPHPQSVIGKAYKAWKASRASSSQQAPANFQIPGIDLVILANPASEAANWLQLQQLEFNTRVDNGRFNKTEVAPGFRTGS